MHSLTLWLDNTVSVWHILFVESFWLYNLVSLLHLSSNHHLHLESIFDIHREAQSRTQCVQAPEKVKFCSYLAKCKGSEVKGSQHHSVKVTKQETGVNIDSPCVPTFLLLGDLRLTIQEQHSRFSLDLSTPSGVLMTGGRTDKTYAVENWTTWKVQKGNE